MPRAERLLCSYVVRRKCIVGCDLVCACDCKELQSKVLSAGSHVLMLSSDKTERMTVR